MGQVQSDLEEITTKLRPGFLSRPVSEDEDEDEDIIWYTPKQQRSPLPPPRWGTGGLWRRLSEEVLGQSCSKESWDHNAHTHSHLNGGNRLWRSQTEDGFSERWTTLGLLRQKSEEVLGGNWPPNRLIRRLSEDIINNKYNSEWDEIWKKEKSLVPEEGYYPGYTKRTLSRRQSEADLRRGGHGAEASWRETCEEFTSKSTRDKMKRRQSEADLRKKWASTDSWKQYEEFPSKSSRSRKSHTDEQIEMSNYCKGNVSHRQSQEGLNKKWTMGSRRQSEEKLHKKESVRRAWGPEDDEVFGRDRKWMRTRKRMGRSQTEEALGERYMDYGLRRRQSEEVLAPRWGDEDVVWWSCEDQEEVFIGDLDNAPRSQGLEDIEDDKLAEWMWIREDLWRRTGTRWTWCLRNGDYVMGESTCTLTLLDVADVLQAKYAFISGGRSRGGSPIITFPDNPGEAELGEEQYRQVVNYLTSIPTLQEVDLGFALIVDRRQCGWGAVKTMLLRISGFFPGLVQEVFVLRPSGFLQRTFTDMGFKFVRDEFKFKVLMCSTVEELQQQIEPSQLTVDLGGSLVYNHDEWIQQRAAIEKFSSNTTQIGQNLRSLCQRLQETEFPNDVSATEALKETHNDERQLVRDDLHMTISHGELLLNCFKVVRDEEGKEKELTSAELPSCKLAHVTAIERLLVQLEETEHNFDEFWFHHEQRLQQCLQLRKFEEDFKQVQFTIDRHLMTLDSMSSDSGDSLQRVESLLRELADFEEESKDDFSKGEELHETGEKLIEDDHYAVDCIRPKCIELQRMCEQYRELVRRRYDVLNKSRELQDRIDKANKWCTAGVDLLAGQQLEKCNTPEGAETALKELETYLETANDLKLNNPREFKTMFDNMITPETRSVVQNVLQRIEDVQSMCDKRRQSLKRLVQKLHRPVQPVVPEPAVPIVQQAPPPSSPAPHSPGTVTTEGERRRKKSLSGGGKRNGSIDRGNKTRVEIIRNDGSGSDTSGSVDMDSDQSNNKIEVPTVDMATLPRKRGHVMRELIETERFYVKELNEVLEGYMREMDSAYMQDLVPEELRGKQDILFGNLPQIYDFHANVFLKDLENCRSTPGMVGKCFVSRKEEFQMYSTYCQNKLASEALQQEVGDNNAFFKECQEKLKHRLPLGAYLLKPVQRITKYQLLIKEMLKFTNSDQGTQELQEAVNTMLSVVKYVNDIMHQVAITGYPGELSELGKLLMQGSFNVWMEDKKTKIKDIRFKPMQRHVFLYEKRFLFCKKKDDAQSAEKASYIFKTELQTADVGLTENVKGDKKKFEVWRPGRARVYTCQAPTVEIKDAWTDAMKQLLMSQFDQLKGKVKKEIPTIPLPPSVPTIQLGPIPKHSESATFQSVHNIENTANNNHTVVSEEPSQGLTSPLDDLIKQEESQGTNSTLEDRDNNQANVPQNMDDYDEEHEPEQDQEHVYSSDEYEEENSAQDSSFNSDSHGMEFTGFIALADYPPIDSSELGLHEGDLVTVIKVGSSGWWYVRNLSTGDEGWAPASYLDTAKRLSSHSTLSMSSTESGGMFGGMRNTVSRSSMNSGMSSGSQVETAEETLV